MNRHNKYLLIGAGLGTLLGILSFMPILVMHNGQYMEYGDYFLQYVPFVKELKRMLLSGSLRWSWNSFLGDGLINAYSYYTVFNPFAWLLICFPDEYIMFGTLFITLLKFSISMVASMLYISRFVRNDTCILIGGLLYTFSGFTIVNTSFYFFLDIIAVFPFLLYGLELLIEENKARVYVISLAVNALINYYFFVSSVIILVIYISFRLSLYKSSSWKHYKDIIHSFFIHSIIGSGIACVSLVPSLYAILGSGKATGTLGTEMSLLYYPQKFLEHLRTLVAPIESGRYHAFYDSTGWSSTGLFLPLFGLCLVCQRCVKKNDWIKKLCVTLVICYLFPFLNSAFNLFSSEAYTRWLYGMALVFSLTSAITLDESGNLCGFIDKKILTYLSLFTALILLIPASVYYLYSKDVVLINRFASACSSELYTGLPIVYLMVGLTFVNYLVLWDLAVSHNVKQSFLVFIVSLVCVLNYSVYNAINYDFHATEYSNDYYLTKALIEGEERQSQGFEYRIDYPCQISNYGLFKNYPAVNNYNSIQNPWGSRFAESVGIAEGLDDTILQTPQSYGEYTDALLSVKYYYDYDGHSKIPSGFIFLHNQNGVDIYMNTNYLPMGFSYDSYVLQSQVSNLTPSDKAKIMLKSLIIEDCDQELVSGMLDHDLLNNDQNELSGLVASRKKVSCGSFHGTSRGFSSEFNSNQPSVVFFSIPFDRGWKITVNDKQAKVFKVNYGLLGVICDSGQSIIEGKYNPRGLLFGFIISLVSLVLWSIYENRRRVNNIIRD